MMARNGMDFVRSSTNDDGVIVWFDPAGVGPIPYSAPFFLNNLTPERAVILKQMIRSAWLAGMQEMKDQIVSKLESL